MFLRSLSLTLVLLATNPAVSLAQDDSVAPPASESQAAETTEPAPTEEEALTPEEIAFNEKSAALGERVLAYDAELRETARLAALDAESTREQLDAIQARFQNDVDAFLTEFIAFAMWKEALLTPEERDAQRRGVESVVGQLAALPQAARERAEAAAQSSPSDQAASVDH